jgi:sigma-B regulation protein RsbU (phosphoserine phosphatase)
MFATLFFGVLDPSNGALTYINGGHEPPMLVGQAGIKARLAPTGPAVGLFPGMEFGIEQVELEAGDTLLVFTDGVLDARNSADQPFGELKLERLIQQPAASAEFCLENILQALHGHMSGVERSMTSLLALRRNAASQHNLISLCGVGSTIRRNLEQDLFPTTFNHLRLALILVLTGLALSV